jgi:PAS domain-containing protein
MAANNVDRKNGKDKRSAGPESKELLIEQMRNRIEFLEKELQSRQEELRARTDEYGGPARERERAELALHESEERFRATFEQAAVGMSQVSLDGRFTRVNKKFCEITGYSPEELIQRSVSDITYPEDVPEEDALIHRLLAGETDVFREKRYVRRAA